jgi:hypothetical protein
VLTLAEKILNAVKALFGLKSELAKAGLDRRERMAALFEKISTCLEETAGEIRAGRYPAGRCQQLLTYAGELPPLIEKELGATKAKEIGDALAEAHSVERLFADRDRPEGHAELVRLEEAAGLMLATANLIQI